MFRMLHGIQPEVPLDARLVGCLGQGAKYNFTMNSHVHNTVLRDMAVLFVSLPAA